MTCRNGAKASGVWSGWPVFGIAGMQMDDRRAGLGRADRRIGDLLGRDRQMRRHRRRVDRTRHGAGDDDLAVVLAMTCPRYDPMSLAALRLCAASAIRRRSRQTLARSPRSSSASFSRRSRSTVVEHLAGPVDAALHLREQISR